MNLTNKQQELLTKMKAGALVIDTPLSASAYLSTDYTTVNRNTLRALALSKEIKCVARDGFGGATWAHIDHQYQPPVYSGEIDTF